MAPSDPQAKQTITGIDQSERYTSDNFKQFLFASIEEGNSTKKGQKKSPANPTEAGRTSAEQQPPEPRTESKEKYGYIDILFRSANAYFSRYKAAYIEEFNLKYNTIKDTLEKKSRETIDLEKSIDLRELEDEIEICKNDKRTFNAYKKKIQQFAGHNPIDWAEKTTLIDFISTLLLISAIEVSVIWYLLKESIGYTDALYSSVLAIVFIVTTASLGAWAHSYTSKDFDINLPPSRKISVKRASGYIGVAITCLLFMFGLGLLSGWRSDSVMTNFDVVLEGYKSILRIDVFTTALITVVGALLLAYKLRRYQWPKFRNYGEWLGTMKQHKDAIKTEENKIRALIEKNHNDYINSVNAIADMVYSISNKERIYEKKLAIYSLELTNTIKRIFDDYVESNIRYRTIDAYPKPDWFNSSKWFPEEGFGFDNPNMSDEEIKLINQRYREIELNANNYLNTTVPIIKSQHEGLKKKFKTILDTIKYEI